LVIGTIADTLGRGVEGIASGISETFFEPVIRLGVTGLARSGKTVFITSLVANLLDRGRMPGLEAARSGRIEAAFLQPQPDDTVPRFAFEDHLAAMTGPDPHWPDSTRAVSELRLSLRVRPSGLLGAVSGPRTVHLDIVDYPGEWLLDLALLDLDFEAWSRDALARAESRRDTLAAPFFAALTAADTDAKLANPWPPPSRVAGPNTSPPRGRGVQRLHARAGSCCPATWRAAPPSPSRRSRPVRAPRGSLAREFARRYEAYKREVVKPFFRAHFSRIDRQIVLVDALGAIHAGPPALEDLRQAMAAILGAFRPGRNAFLSSLLGRRVDRILFAATKADHLHHEQHPRLEAVIEALVTEARRRAEFSGAETRAMAIASLRATTEEVRSVNGAELGLVRGHASRRRTPRGTAPRRSARRSHRLLLAPARDGAQTWLSGDYGVMRFAPAALSLRNGEGPPHIRLDRAAEFLIGDRL
jgi:predicted YcjX-like family ATPase